MLDEDSLLVTYNTWRGEPRSRGQKRAIAEGIDAGDCVDCNACVVVCPMGIDIRDGNQLECITCALCIDACDDIMTKIGRPEGLISYSTLRHFNSHVADAEAHGRQAATASQRSVGVSHIVRPRTLVYAGLWSLIGVLMLIGLLTRDRLDINVLPDRNPLFVTLSDGSIRNGYTLKLLNMLPEPRQFTVAVEGLPGASLWLADPEDSGATSLRVGVEADRLREIKVFVSQPAAVAAGLDALPVRDHRQQRPDRRARRPSSRSDAERRQRELTTMTCSSARGSRTPAHRLAYAGDRLRLLRHDHRGQRRAGVRRDRHLSGARRGEQLRREPALRRAPRQAARAGKARVGADRARPSMAACSASRCRGPTARRFAASTVVAHVGRPSTTARTGSSISRHCGWRRS